MASVNLLVGLALDCHLRENRSAGLQRAYSVFDEMNAGGNLIAQSEKIELKQLEEMLVRLSVDRSDRVAADNNASVPDGRRFGHPSEDAVSTTTAPLISTHDTLPTLCPSMPDENGFANLFTSAQVMDLANSIGLDDMGWMSQAIMEHSIW